MSPTQVKALRNTAFNAFNPDSREIVNPDSPEYVELFPADSDPIVQMRDAVDFASSGGLQLFSGCRGSGKTTQLNRLRRLLEEDHYMVFHLSALDYLSPADPVEASELLLILAAAISQAAAPILQENPAHQGYFSRIWDYLKLTEINFEEFGLKGGAAGIEAEFQGTFRTVDSFRARLRDHLKSRLSELKNATHKYFDDLAVALAAKVPHRTGFILILDQFEQIRGGLTNADQVIESVLRLFTHHIELFRLPGWHAIYTVPPWLHLAHPGSVKLAAFLPCIKLWKYGAIAAAAVRDEDGWIKMREIVARRVGHEKLDTLFGSPGPDGFHPLMEQLIQHSGGHFRDLFLLVGKCILAARTLPIQPLQAESSIADLASSMPVSETDSLLLREIHQTHQLCFPDNDAKTVLHFARLLDHHLILEFRNGEPWFDIHPAIVKQVERTAARVESRKAAAATTS